MAESMVEPLSLQVTFLLVLAGLTVLFAAATALGAWLAQRAEGADESVFVQLLNSRLRSAWGIVALFTLAFAVGGYAVVLIFALASFLALREFMALTPIRAADYWALVLAFYVAIPVQYVLVAGGAYGWYAVFIPVYLFLVLPGIMAWKLEAEQFLERIAKVQFGVMITVYCVSHAPAIATLQITGYEDRAPLLLLYFLLVVYLFDLLSLIASAAVGRTPLRSNPTKSREGVWLGGAGATMAGVLLAWMTPFAWWAAALMSAAIVLAGFVGGVVLATIKRGLGAEDQWTEEGMQLSRGVLQRLDALAFAAPVFFHLTLYFYA
jgi:phosphatidate cytidylyltransferase